MSLSVSNNIGGGSDYKGTEIVAWASREIDSQTRAFSSTALTINIPFNHAYWQYAKPLTSRIDDEGWLHCYYGYVHNSSGTYTLFLFHFKGDSLSCNWTFVETKTVQVLSSLTVSGSTYVGACTESTCVVVVAIPGTSVGSTYSSEINYETLEESSMVTTTNVASLGGSTYVTFSTSHTTPLIRTADNIGYFVICGGGLYYGRWQEYLYRALLYKVDHGVVSLVNTLYSTTSSVTGTVRGSLNLIHAGSMLVANGYDSWYSYKVNTDGSLTKLKTASFSYGVGTYFDSEYILNLASSLILIKVDEDGTMTSVATNSTEVASASTSPGFYLSLGKKGVIARADSDSIAYGIYYFNNTLYKKALGTFSTNKAELNLIPYDVDAVAFDGGIFNSIMYHGGLDITPSYNVNTHNVFTSPKLLRYALSPNGTKIANVYEDVNSTLWLDIILYKDQVATFNSVALGLTYARYAYGAVPSITWLTDYTFVISTPYTANIIEAFSIDDKGVITSLGSATLEAGTTSLARVNDTTCLCLYKSYSSSYYFNACLVKVGETLEVYGTKAVSEQLPSSAGASYYNPMHLERLSENYFISCCLYTSSSYTVITLLKVKEEGAEITIEEANIISTLKDIGTYKNMYVIDETHFAIGQLSSGTYSTPYLDVFEVDTTNKTCNRTRYTTVSVTSSSSNITDVTLTKGYYPKGFMFTTQYSTNKQYCSFFEYILGDTDYLEAEPQRAELMQIIEIDGGKWVHDVSLNGIPITYWYPTKFAISPSVSKITGIIKKLDKAIRKIIAIIPT